MSSFILTSLGLLRAVLIGVKMAIQNGYETVHVLMNAKAIGDFDWEINSIIVDIKLRFSNFAYVELSFIPRILNSVAHLFAKFC